MVIPGGPADFQLFDRNFNNLFLDFDTRTGSPTGRKYKVARQTNMMVENKKYEWRRMIEALYQCLLIFNSLIQFFVILDVFIKKL